MGRLPEDLPDGEGSQTFPRPGFEILGLASVTPGWRGEGRSAPTGKFHTSTEEGQVGVAAGPGRPGARLDSDDESRPRDRER